MTRETAISVVVSLIAGTAVFGVPWLFVFARTSWGLFRLRRDVIRSNVVIAEAIRLRDQMIGLIDRRDLDGWYETSRAFAAWWRRKSEIIGPTMIGAEADRTKDEHHAPLVAADWPDGKDIIENLRRLDDWCIRIARAQETRRRITLMPRSRLDARVPHAE